MNVRHVHWCGLVLAAAACHSTEPDPPATPLISVTYAGDRSGTFRLAGNQTPLDTTDSRFAAAAITPLGNVYFCAASPATARRWTWVVMALGAVPTPGVYSLPPAFIPGSTWYTPGALFFHVSRRGNGADQYWLTQGSAVVVALSTDSIHGSFTGTFTTVQVDPLAPPRTIVVSEGTFHLPIVPISSLPHSCQLY